jgi:hypothetical protein
VTRLSGIAVVLVYVEWHGQFNALNAG